MTFFMGRFFEGSLILPFAAAGRAAATVMITICHNDSSPENNLLSQTELNIVEPRFISDSVSTSL
jgi:hypothetical protein